MQSNGESKELILKVSGVIISITELKLKILILTIFH